MTGTTPFAADAVATQDEYQRKIVQGLDRAYADATASERTFTIGRDRMIIFSDLHKGARNDADDFRRCERA